LYYRKKKMVERGEIWSKLHSEVVVIRKYTNSTCKMRHIWQNIVSITSCTRKTNLWEPPTVQPALPNWHSKRQLQHPLGSAPPSDSWQQKYKNVAPWHSSYSHYHAYGKSTVSLLQRSPTSTSFANHIV
jgi:hypothetical protein